MKEIIGKAKHSKKLNLSRKLKIGNKIKTGGDEIANEFNKYFPEQIYCRSWSIFSKKYS